MSAEQTGHEKPMIIETGGDGDPGDWTFVEKRKMLKIWLERRSPFRRVLWLLPLAVVVLLLTDPCKLWLRDQIGRWFHVFLLSMSLSLTLTPAAEMVALYVGAVDWPNRRKAHHRPTPRLGGLAVFAGVGLSLWHNGIPDVRVNLMLFAASLLLAVGMADDIRGVPAAVRLLVQISLAGVLVVGNVTLALFPSSTVAGTVLNAGITVLWVVGITNAFNFFDGMDGLASGLAILMAGFLGAIAFMTRQIHLGWMSVAIFGACLGFLPYNFRWHRPARIFLGDCGSTVIGFLLAGMAVHGEWAVGHPLLNLSPPLLIFSILIFDVIHTTISRIARGDVRSFRQWIEFTGRDHLHHRFEALLRSKRQATLMVWLLAFTLSLAALAIRHVTLNLAVVLLLQSIAILVLVTIIERAGNLHDRRR